MNPVNSLKRFSRSLAARLFLLYGVTFAVFVLAGLGTFYRYQFTQHVEEAQESAGMLAEVAAQAVGESAAIGDYDAVKRTLQKTLLRTPFRSAMFVDLSGGAIMLESGAEREAAAPAWLRRLIADRLYDVDRNIVVGGRDYGAMRLVFDIDRTANQIWKLALEVLAVCALCLLAGLWVTRSLLKRWLGSLGRLQAYLAQFDTLTGLPNRNLFRDRFAQTLTLAQRNDWQVGVMFVDLDRFKAINDSLGHGAGDRLLTQVSARLQSCVRPGDTVARLGGDEFALVLSNLARADDACLVAEKVLAALSSPFDLDGQEVYISASLGISVFPGDGTNADVLLRNADTAMHRAKEQGRNNYQFYLPEMNELAVERLGIEMQLRRALERGEFRLHYQPKVDLASGSMCGLEALLRWQHPERGLVPPLEFIKLLEETGLIVPVGEWVVRSVCEQINRWRAEGLKLLPVAINLSARQFRQKNLDAVIASIVAETGADPALLEFELTESMLMADPEEAVRTMKRMKASGVRLSLDDFGTGYSSLAYLKKFPLDTLKIDRAFVRDITTDADDATLAVAIISLAHTMDLKVVAEGVEAEAQLDFLAGHGCDEMQGYYFAAPMEADKCAQALREGRRLRKPAPGTGKTAILLVDDDPEYLRTLERALSHDGYEIQTAAGPQEALGALAKKPYQIVVSDQTMPEMSGVEFLAVVQSLYPDAVRIVATIRDDGGTVTDAVNKAGIHKYLWKSWKAARLRTEVRDAYQRYGQPFLRKQAA